MVRSGKSGGLHLKQIAYYKRTGEYHPTTLSSERSGIRRAAKKFIFEENKLFYVGKDRKQMRLVIVSDEEKKKVLKKCHENAAGAHHGISRTLTLVESNYYWTSVTNDVKQWVYACQHCQVTKSTTIAGPKTQPFKTEDPWTAVTIELMGPFNVTNRSHKYIIIMTDLFTRWTVILPLRDTSAAEIAKALINVFFLYGPPQKMPIDEGKELVYQINEELFALFGMKQIVLSYPQTDDVNERMSKTIKAFLSKFCIDYPNNWDEHLSAIAYAFNLTNLEANQNTPYFQMFKRNPYVVEPQNICVEGEYSMFAKIFEATKKVSQALEEEKTSDCQVGKNISDEQKVRNKITVKRKTQQLNSLQLKVGHEVLRQRKNWWKDGRFQSEWVGPCIIDYITNNGCAILRDATGSRLKRPIKMSHLKPYIRESNEKDNHYFLQGAVVVDHDYIGLSERSNNSSQPINQDSVADGEINAYTRDVMSAVQISPAACKEQESTDGKLESELREDHCIESNTAKPEQWPSPCWTLQTKIEDT
ncbi:gypsy retrotransposon integrase-like protein 1 [Chiroxiphia lanceolata]|uniref:gypsy retrotransposon integrase-like protein 1 n=1 Tax=Chiroxiphia lanceolata TaxID=296741 RepID=UPI0013CF2652|nr:gypsy retrotransposon integrase-like protein 1 [Chiroxiphia lanceolata]XP_032531119.1 gypsy retrotransposon integrase-like protein 1 [Chiroxiphia lanceolata]XP_032531120.1 gypsy retrotransposon integrase-like protein 1 [Chiroxiphia lanceolata]